MKNQQGFQRLAGPRSGRTGLCACAIRALSSKEWRLPGQDPVPAPVGNRPVRSVARSDRAVDRPVRRQIRSTGLLEESADVASDQRPYFEVGKRSPEASGLWICSGQDCEGLEATSKSTTSERAIPSWDRLRRIGCSVELWEIILHGYREPQDPIRLTSTEFYNRQLNASARDKIRSGINRKLLDQVNDIGSAKELWDRIVVLTEGTDLIQSSLYETAKQEAHRFMIREGESLADAYARLGALKVRIKGLGAEKYDDGFEMNEGFIKSKVIAMIVVKQEDTNLALNLQIMTKSADLNSDDLVTYVAPMKTWPRQVSLSMKPRQLTRSNNEAQQGEDDHLATAMDPWSRVNYSLITPEAIMAMKSPPEMNPLSGRVPEAIS
ncbi:hypothetical protein QYE76_030728 [Lolium multiflorum]|uniref:Uncharacterized protein n=1 Tax=Lolium multiflorum TaxID=4521 RepID=A0AAD8VJI7_LOLMU|nr:hypothetical protein QYE76_030728 [Lolium multiflorum]